MIHERPAAMRVYPISIANKSGPEIDQRKNVQNVTSNGTRI